MINLNTYFVTDDLNVFFSFIFALFKLSNLVRRLQQIISFVFKWKINLEMKDNLLLTLLEDCCIRTHVKVRVWQA